MTEKIEWYKEVLELEPNSKVFFALAKLLVENDDATQAIQVLKCGLERHPDFMEARLFLIELMYRNGLADECTQQVQQLSKLFAHYAGFWQAWAACLSASPGESDTASIVRFLAAHFLVGPLQISEVFNQGLAEILKRHQNGENAASEIPDSQKKEAETPVIPNLETTQPELIQENPRLAAEAPVIEETVLKEDAVQEAVSSEPGPEAIGAAINLETLPPVLTEDLELHESVADESEAESKPQTVEADLILVPPQEDKSEADSFESYTEVNKDPEDEGFSLRTRSMAEVLADQGDYKGAIEIYDELVNNEKNPDEAENMHKRIEELRAMLNTKVPPEDTPIQMEAPAPKKEKLLGILEALAKRVEARMHN